MTARSNLRRSESTLLRLMSRLSRLSRWLNDVTAVRLVGHIEYKETSRISQCLWCQNGPMRN